MRDLDLTTLRLFVAVCEQRSLSRAGEQVHLGASAISKRLTQLEEQLRTPLFKRSRYGVEPTPAAGILLEHARIMLASADRIARDMAAYRDGVQEQIRLLASVSSITESLPDDIASFLRQPDHTHIRVAVEERVSSDIVRSVRNGLAPVGVCWDAADLEGLQTRPYRNDHLAVAVPPQHPLAALTQCTFKETLEFEHIGLASSSAVNIMLARAAAIIGHRLYYRAVVSTFDASLRCVQAGLGLAIIPREIAEPASREGRLRVVDLTDVWAHRRFCICFREETQLSPASRLLVEHLSKVAGNAESSDSLSQPSIRKSITIWPGSRDT